MGDGGYNVGYITAGEYLRYTIDVTNSSESDMRCSLRAFPFQAVRADVHRMNTIWQMTWLHLEAIPVFAYVLCIIYRRVQRALGHILITMHVKRLRLTTQRVVCS